MRDVENGYVLRYTHANVASFFFIFVYAHIGRGLWYGSYRSPRTIVWSIGVIILVLMMAIGFLGYVYSPKWFNLLNNNILIIIHENLQGGAAVILFNTRHLNGIKYSLQPLQSKQGLIFLSSQLQLKKGNIISISPYSLALIRGSNNLTLLPPSLPYGTGRGGGRNFSSTAFRFEEYKDNQPEVNASAQISSMPALSEAETNSKKIIISNRLTEFLIKNELNPIFSYEELQLNEVRKKILFETRNLSGVYMILNKITLDFYIGSASTGKIYSRFYRHLISFNGSKIVKLAVKKYKLTSFAFLVLELFPEIITKENNNKLIDLEDFYLKTMLPNYNILTEAGSSFGYKHTEITRLNMSKNYSESRKEWIKNLNKGKTLSPEIIEKIREKALNRKPLTYSAEALATMKKKSKPITLYNLDRTVYGNFPSISDAAKTVGCDIKTINRALKTEKKILKKRFIVKLN
jgi:group I intron endonuclease